MLAGRHYHIIALAFAKQEVLAEEKISQPNSSERIGFANVVHIDAAAFDVFSSLSLRWAETAKHEQFNQRNRAIELRLFNIFGWDLAHDFVEGRFGNALQSAAKQNLTRADRFGAGGGAVD